MHLPFAFLTGTQVIIVLVVGVLLFGRRLPELGHYLVKGINEFKRGVEDNLDSGGTIAIGAQLLIVLIAGAFFFGWLIARGN
jgi:TatA/E family protein of Tat protein translocase